MKLKNLEAVEKFRNELFKNLKGINIIVFYPKHGVSPMQEEQMRKQLGDNVDIVAINGNFDDAQNSVKYIFSSEEFKNYSNENNIMFSSANSINIGRLFPQVIYYISTYLNLVNSGTIREGEEFNVVVPTGNFGNILAGYIAKKLGIPIKKFISASNKNNVLSDFFKTGIYNKNRSFFATCSPSMDILISSNFERYLYYSTGENSERVIELMNDLYSKGTLKVSDSELTQIQEEFYGEFSNDEETVNAIKNVYAPKGGAASAREGVKSLSDYAKEFRDVVGEDPMQAKLAARMEKMALTARMDVTV